MTESKTRWLTLPIPLSRALTPFEARLVEKYDRSQPKISLILAAARRHNSVFEFVRSNSHIVLSFNKRRFTIPCRDFADDIGLLEDVGIIVADMKLGN